MNQWQIPAKTFLLGEYAALSQASAILLTTKPCFSAALEAKGNKQPFHIASPAGKLLAEYSFNQSLNWYDPYQGIGGLGASTAEFIACYEAICQWQQKTPSLDELLSLYYRLAWNGQGQKPSGYDLIAQFAAEPVYINRQKQVIEPVGWPFESLDFILFHTGIKLTTHEHLQAIQDNLRPEALDQTVLYAQSAFFENNANKLIEAVNCYHQQLKALHRVADHSLKIIDALEALPQVLAVKGCGAMGADVILVMCANKERPFLSKQLTDKGFRLLASKEQLALKKNQKK